MIFCSPFERIIPTPIEKKTINGMNLYGWFVRSVKPVRSGAEKRMPAIKIKIESA